MSVTFATVGELMLDVVAQRGAHDHAGAVRVRVGGTAANGAVWAARAGARATAVGRVGDDAAGRALRAELEARGIETAFAVDPAEPTGTVLLVDAERVVDRGANRNLVPADLPALAVDALLVSGNALRHADSRSAGLAALAGGAAWTGATGGASDNGNARVLVVNAREARALTDARAEDAARLLAERYEIACVTLGGEGALLAHDDRVERCAAERNVPEPTRFGAGDAFAAVLLVELARGLSPAEALVAACAAGTSAAAGRP